ncbi:MAG: SBBP repeat-containing protein, partial [Candidatus Hodarchaeota archaeon]
MIGLIFPVWGINVIADIERNTFHPVEDREDHHKSKNLSIPFSGFIQNLGQLSDARIRYYFSAGTSWVGFGRSKITLRDTATQFSLSFPRSQMVNPVGYSQKPHATNFFYGRMQLTDVPSWNEIWYQDLYPGIDLRYYMSEQGLKYDFLLSPGADPNQIAVQVDESMILEVSDQIVSLHSSTHPETIFQDTKLQVWQEDGSSIPAQFISHPTTSNTYGFQVSSFDPTQILIIDPIWLSFGTYIGGSRGDDVRAIVTDSSGNIYVAGATESSDFPIVNGYSDTFSGGDVLGDHDIWVAKFNPTLDTILFSTYLGGSGKDIPLAIAIDSTDNIYVSGWSSSTDYILVNETDHINVGGAQTWDTVITKLYTAGNSIFFSTYYGADDRDEFGYGIAADDDGNCYVAGSKTYSGVRSSFVTKYGPYGTVLLQKAIEADGDDEVLGMVRDNLGNIYLTGWTSSTNFPVLNAYQSTNAGGWDAFVMKLNATLDIVFSTYFGGSGDDLCGGIDIDLDGNVYISGHTKSTDLQTQNAYQPTHGGADYDDFVAKFNATGNGLIFSTYLGGSNNEGPIALSFWTYANKIAVDSDGNSYTVGITTSSDFPTLNAFKTNLGGMFSAFVVKMDPTGTANFSTYLGGGATDKGHSIACDNNGKCYVGGLTASSNFPTSTGCYQDSR